MTTAITTAPKVTARSRSRALEGAPALAPATPAPVPQELQDLAKTVFSEGKKTNAAKGKAEKARKDLYAKMKAAGILKFHFLTTLEDGTNAALDVDVFAKPENYIHIPTLLALVGQEKFLEIVTASQAAVTEKAGGAVATQCLRSGMKEENVHVTAPK